MHDLGAVDWRTLAISVLLEIGRPVHLVDSRDLPPYVVELRFDGMMISASRRESSAVASKNRGSE